ncbi:MAG: hypothetical protein OXI91_00710 [Chloroflexota bacterium]|nr:hypothetical protein [Chloroflexota bacterium]
MLRHPTSAPLSFGGFACFAVSDHPVPTVHHHDVSVANAYIGIFELLSHTLEHIGVGVPVIRIQDPYHIASAKADSFVHAVVDAIVGFVDAAGDVALIPVQNLRCPLIRTRVDYHDLQVMLVDLVDNGAQGASYTWIIFD